MWEAVAGLLALLHAALRFYLHRQEKRDVHDENIQGFRKGLTGRSTGTPLQSNDLDAALADQHDRVQSAVRGSERSGEGNYHEGVAG